MGLNQTVVSGSAAGQGPPGLEICVQPGQISRRRAVRSDDAALQLAGFRSPRLTLAAEWPDGREHLCPALSGFAIGRSSRNRFLEPVAGQLR